MERSHKGRRQGNFASTKPEWPPLIRDFTAWMKYRNLSQNTQRIYSGAVTVFADFLEAEGRDHGTAQVTRRDVEAFVRHRLTQVKPATVSADFHALQQFWKWMVREEEIDRDAMHGADGSI